MQPDNSFTRRALIAGGTALCAAAAEEKAASGKLKVAIFSKHLQFLQGEALAAGAAEIGFDGIDLAVTVAVEALDECRNVQARGGRDLLDLLRA